MTSLNEQFTYSKQRFYQRLRKLPSNSGYYQLSIECVGYYTPYTLGFNIDESFPMC